VTGGRDDFDYRLKLAKATEFLEVAEVALAFERYDAAVSLAVSAGVNFADAHCLKTIGRYHNGQDHEGALVLLQKSGLTGVSIGRHLKRILSVKNKAQYASVRCTRTDAEQCLKRASRIQDLILEYLVPDESEK